MSDHIAEAGKKVTADEMFRELGYVFVRGVHQRVYLNEAEATRIVVWSGDDNITEAEQRMCGKWEHTPLRNGEIRAIAKLLEEMEEEDVQG